MKQNLTPPGGRPQQNALTTVQAGVVPHLDDSAIDSAAREIRSGGMIALFFFLAFGAFAAFVPLQSAVHAPAVMSVEGRHQVVQHAEGGTIARLMVRENQPVRRGALLLEIAGGDTREQVRSLTNTAISLLAQRARLQAELGRSGKIVAPEEFAALDPEYQPAASLALADQAQLMSERRGALSAEARVTGQRALQLGEQRQGAEIQVVSAEEQLRILREEIDALSPLIEKGFVSKNRVRQLQRQEAQLVGAVGEQRAAVARTREAIGETSLSILSAEQQFRASVVSDLQAVEIQLGDLLPRLAAARERQDKLRLRAAVDGVVLGLGVQNEGAVIGPGQRIMDIVPRSSKYFVEANVRAVDIDDIAPGTLVDIRFVGLPHRQMPMLRGKVRSLSPDRFVDEKSGEAYYRAEISLPAAALAKATEVAGGAERIRPGLPMETVFQVRKRTLLSYLTEPLTASLSRAFSEN